MNLAIPLPEMSHRWLDRAKARLQADPAAVPLFEHSGRVDPDIITDMVTRVEAFSRTHGDPVPLRKRLLMVMLEAMDNVSRHSLSLMDEATFALLVRDREGYRLATGNAVPHATATLLAHRVDILNSMDRDDLKEHYLRLLACGGRSSNGGAGLGLLTMARKSAPPLVVLSDLLGPFTSYFTIEVRVGMDEDRPLGAA